MSPWKAASHGADGCWRVYVCPVAILLTCSTKRLFFLHGWSVCIVTRVVALYRHVATCNARPPERPFKFLFLLFEDLLHGVRWVIWWGHSGLWDSAQSAPRRSSVSAWGTRSAPSFMRSFNENRLCVGCGVASRFLKFSSGLATSTQNKGFSPLQPLSLFTTAMLPRTC
jgi:hypothetical protein